MDGGVSLCLFVSYEPSVESLAKWASETITQNVPSAASRPLKIWEKGSIMVSTTGPHLPNIQEAVKQHTLTSEDQVLVVVCFADGMAEESKAQFASLHTECRSNRWALQVINGKNGAHNFFTRKQDINEIQTNLVQSILLKIQPATTPSTPPLSPQETEDSLATGTVTSSDSTQEKKSSAHEEDSPPTTPTNRPKEIALFEHNKGEIEASNLGIEQSPTETEWVTLNKPAAYYQYLLGNLGHRLLEGHGECLCKVGVDRQGKPVGLGEEEYTDSLATLQKLAVDLKSQSSLVIEKTMRENPITRCAEVLIRREGGEDYIDMRIAICGNVDSGKSTLVGVLTKGQLDNGRGSVRSKVFKHKHEQDTGRTSSISEQLVGFDAVGNVVNYEDYVQETAPGKHQISSREIAETAAKIITFYDLAGHEKYLKTTVMGMTGSMPDYAAIVVSANNGVQRMTKEHLGLCLALKIPFFVVITRVDMTPEVVTKNTTETIFKLVKHPSVNKLPFMVRKPDDVVICAKNIQDDRIVPVFHVSNVTGENLPYLRKFLNLLPVRKDWTALSKQPLEVIIDSTFYVTGVGTVVGGFVAQGVIHPNDTVLLGPNSNGHFRTTIVKSIHVKQINVQKVEAGTAACFALKKERRSDIRKGMVLIDVKNKPQAVWEFEAEIVVLYHSTTILSNYQPVVHCGTVRQSCAITLVDRDILRTGDKAKVRFRFMYKPEYVKIGSKLIFREGRTKGLGTICTLHPMTNT